MRKTSKVLAFVLSLAFICAVVVVASFATGTDIKVNAANTFESLSDSWSYTASDGSNPRVTETGSAL